MPGILTKMSGPSDGRNEHGAPEAVKNTRGPGSERIKYDMTGPSE